MRRMAIVLAVINALVCTPLLAQTATFEQLSHDSYAAYQGKDYVRMLQLLQQMDVLRPGHPRVLVNLADAFALNGKTEESLGIIRRLVAMKVFFDTSDPDFDSLRANAQFVELDGKIRQLRAERIAGAEVAFRIPEKGLITEGLAADSNGAFFVSSVRKGKIVRIGQDGTRTDFYTAPPHTGISGMGVDNARRILWGCSTSSVRVEGVAKGTPNNAALIALDLRSGKLRRRVAGPDAQTFCDDLTVASDGSVFVSDSSGAVLRLAPGATQLETLVPRGIIRSPQGSVLSADGRRLYVSDYGGPIRAVDVKSGRVTPLQFPGDVQVHGIDGLTRWKNHLIGVQNGIEPARIVRFDLAADGLRVTGSQILEMNHPEMDEPTIGKVVSDLYYFVGASQGHLFDEEKLDESKLTDGLIFRIRMR